MPQAKDILNKLLQAKKFFSNKTSVEDLKLVLPHDSPIYKLLIIRCDIKTKRGVVTEYTYKVLKESDLKYLDISSECTKLVAFTYFHYPTKEEIARILGALLKG